MRKALVLLLFVPALYAQSTSPAQIRAAATRAVAITQQGSTGFYKFMNCFSCHDHALPTLAWQTAREHGVPVDETAAARVIAKGLLNTPNLSSIDDAVQDPAIIDPAPSEGWALIAAHAAGVQPNLVTAAYARRLATWQRPDGHWPTLDVRPPQSYSLFTTTAVAARAIQLYMPPPLRDQTKNRLERAKAWLLANEPKCTEDATFRLFGLHFVGATGDEIQRATSGLLALQRADGGWGEIPHMPSDAYSTGEALVALNEVGGVLTADAAWQKGLEYLVSTQETSGAWHVHTRMVSPATVSPPYFETSFPHGHDQFLSTAATAWAAAGLMLALPKVANPARPPALPALAPKGLQPWMETALFGTAAELKEQLDAGLDPNSKTENGTTVLMMAAQDPDKVKLLIDHGADVRAKAKSGYTALLVATSYFGDSQSVKLLLDHGADVRPGDGVANDASPMVLAAMAGDTDNIALLAAKGADANHRMRLAGQFPFSPMVAAVGFGDPAVVKALVTVGANVRERDSDSMTPLHWAMVGHHSEAARVLIASGADVNAVDRFGYTPLLYAADIDFGDAETVTALLQAGADPNVKARSGKTAAMLARDYPYTRTVLEKTDPKD